jgi:hypothetical protein
MDVGQHAVGIAQGKLGDVGHMALRVGASVRADPQGGGSEDIAEDRDVVGRQTTLMSLWKTPRLARIESM